MNKKINLFLKSIGVNKEKRTDILSQIGSGSLEKNLITVINYLLNNDNNVFNEVETKILNISKKYIIKKLEKINAINTFDGYIEDDRYDFDSGIFGKEKIFFRIRKTVKGNFITIKKQADNNKIKKGLCSKDLEYEVEINDIKELLSYIKNLGLKLIKDKHCRKHRLSFVYKKNVHFDLDKYSDIPLYLEIESDNEKTVSKLIKKLGLKDFKTVTYGYRKLKEYYGV